MISQMTSHQQNWAYVYLNGVQLTETKDLSSTSTGWVGSTGGRVVTLDVNAGDSIDLRTDRMDGTYYETSFCIEFIPKL